MQQLDFGAIQTRRGQFDRQTLQAHTHLGDLLEAFAGHGRDPHRALRLALQGALGDQALQGGAHRHRAGAPDSREVTDFQALPGLEATGEQIAADPLIELLLQVSGHRPSPGRYRRRPGQSGPASQNGACQSFLVVKKAVE
ncbi:hypothetical protein D3C84_989890 [compost metagenome]